MSLGGTETPGSAELRDVITLRSSPPGVCCVRDGDEPDRREPCAVGVARFADLIGNAAVLRRRYAPRRESPLIDRRFHRFSPPWPIAAFIWVEGIEPTVHGQQRG